MWFTNFFLLLATGEVDFYVNGEICWAFELLRNGNKLREHRERFNQDGKYSRVLKLNNDSDGVGGYAVVDFTLVEPGICDADI